MNHPPPHEKIDVLIVGAGPTGLILAIRLARAGVNPRIIDKTAEPGTTSRALVVHARTLELYRQLGLAETLIGHGVEFRALNYWVGGRRKARFEFGAIGGNLTPFPEILICPQDVHERLLIEHLRGLGVEVEREVEFVALEGNHSPIRVRLRHAQGEEEHCEATFAAGCDGGHSPLRHALEIGYPGGSYSDVFYVADVELADSTIRRGLHLSLEDQDFLAVFPLRGERNVRFVGTLQGHPKERREGLQWEDVNAEMIKRLKLDVKQMNWFSTYRVQHRVADHFRCGDVFLLGDAAHVHSPVGGQGMNTGIGDAVNLAWKLADVLKGHADRSLLDTYEAERRPFALRLVATTDRAFTVATNNTRMGRWVKTRLVPLALPVLLRMQWFRRLIYRTISQTRITYRAIPSNEGSAGRLRAGDRLPWVPMDTSGGGPEDNFQPLQSCDWQVHVYGEATHDVVAACERQSLPLHVFAWNQRADRVGLVRNALYLVRPDSYIGFISRGGNPSELTRYLERHRLALGRHGVVVS